MRRLRSSYQSRSVSASRKDRITEQYYRNALLTSSMSTGGIVGTIGALRLARCTTPHDASLLGRTGRRTFGRELQDGNELLQSDSEDLGNVYERLALGNGV